VLAHYRRHDDSETNRLRNDNLIDHDVVKAIEICAAHVPASERARLRSAACEAFARRSLKKLKAETRTHAQRADLEFADRLEAVKIALRGMTHSPRRLRQLRDELARLEAR